MSEIISPGLWGRLLVEPPRPDLVRRSSRAQWLVVATVCVGAFMGQLDASIVTLALPALRRGFHASLAGTEWVALAYLVVLVAVVTAVGRLGDVIGRKLLYTYGFAVFTVATIGCGAAPNLGVLVGCRAVQAVGAAMLQANSVALIVTTLPAGQRARGLGLQGAAQALGLALGPTVGGLLLAAGGWRWVFLATVPAGVVGTVAGWFLLPRTRDRSEPGAFDWLGLAFFSIAVLGLLAGFSYGATAWWILGAAGTLGVIAVERSAARPLLPPALLRRTGRAVSAGLVGYLALFGLLFATPFYCQDVLHLAAARTGLLLTVLPAAIGLTAPIAGALADRRMHWPWAPVGLAVLGAALVLLAATRPGQVGLALLLGLAGVGFGVFNPANNAAVMSGVRSAGSGQLGGLLNMTRGLGTALGVAVTGLVLAGSAEPGHGFRTACWLLAALTATAALVVSRPHGTPDPGR